MEAARLRQVVAAELVARGGAARAAFDASRALPVRAANGVTGKIVARATLSLTCALIFRAAVGSTTANLGFPVATPVEAPRACDDLEVTKAFALAASFAFRAGDAET